MQNIAMIGFGEAATAFVSGWRVDGFAGRFTAYDIKTDSVDEGVKFAKWRDYQDANVEGADHISAALSDASAVFSLVTAEQARNAASSASQGIAGKLFFDGNSCAPATKQGSARLIEAAGGRYVDMAIMAPVHPNLHKTPVLLSGPHSEEAVEFLVAMGMNADVIEGEVGGASAIKMTRSIMIKGLEALVMECALAGREARVEDVVFASLEKSFPGFDWEARAAYMMERMTTHGIRRAAEMDEVARMVDDLGLDGVMSHATAQRQRQCGEMEIKAESMEGDFRQRADIILARMKAKRESHGT